MEQFLAEKHSHDLTESATLQQPKHLQRTRTKPPSQLPPLNSALFPETTRTDTARRYHTQTSIARKLNSMGGLRMETRARYAHLVCRFGFSGRSPFWRWCPMWCWRTGESATQQWSEKAPPNLFEERTQTHTPERKKRRLNTTQAAPRTKRERDNTTTPIER